MGGKSRRIEVVDLNDVDSCSRVVRDDRCTCRDAVVRAYHEMMVSGATPETALDVAIRVFRYHHPSASPSAAREVADWISPMAQH